MKRLAIVPVKKYSERIANKNFIQVGEHPMYWWSVEAAVESGLFHRIIISTNAVEIVDEEMIKNKADSCIFIQKRPEELCTSITRVAEVCAHVLEAQEEDYDLFCLLLPTNPLRNAEDIRAGLTFFSKVPQSDFVMSVSKYSFSAWYALQRKDNGLSPIVEDIYDVLRQDLSDTYYCDGAVCWGRTEVFLGRAEKKLLINSSTVFFQIPPERALDIDDELDLILARTLVERRK